MEVKSILSSNKNRIVSVKAHPNQSNLFGVVYEDSLLEIYDAFISLKNEVYCVYLKCI